MIHDPSTFESPSLCPWLSKSLDRQGTSRHYRIFQNTTRAHTVRSASRTHDHKHTAITNRVTSVTIHTMFGTFVQRAAHTQYIRIVKLSSNGLATEDGFLLFSLPRLEEIPQLITKTTPPTSL